MSSDSSYGRRFIENLTGHNGKIVAYNALQFFNKSLFKMRVKKLEFFGAFCKNRIYYMLYLYIVGLPYL